MSREEVNMDEQVSLKWDIDFFVQEWMTGSYGSFVVVLRKLTFTMSAPVHTLTNSSYSHQQFTLTPTVHTLTNSSQ